MAVFHITMFSNALHRLTEMTAIVPVEINEGASAGQCPQPEGPMKTVMLLHGFSGTHSDWLFGSRIQQLAMKYHIAVLCPTGENAFYVDDTKRDALYERYLCEVLAFARKVFPLSEKVEDTIIGGLSMAGSGALRTGLRHHCTFLRAHHRRTGTAAGASGKHDGERRLLRTRVWQTVRDPRQ